MQRKLCQLLLCVVLFLVYTGCYLGILSHVIYYHGQHHLFLYSSAYFRDCMNNGGWLRYITDFVVQFFYSPGMGGVLLAFLLTLVYVCGRSIVRSLTAKEDVVQVSLLPSLYLFIYTASVEHSLKYVLGTCLTVYVLALLMWFFRPCFRRVHSLFRRISFGKRTCAWVTLVVIVLYGMVAYWRFPSVYKESERLTVEAERAMAGRDWPKVLELTDEYLQTNQRSQLMCYFRNMALCRTGKLLDHLFDYALPMGERALFIPWESNGHKVEYGHWLYEELGQINEAQRWDSETLVKCGLTGACLTRLARYNIVNGRAEVAMHYIRLLKRSLFYRREASELEKRVSTGSVDRLRSSLGGTTETPAHFVDANEPCVEFQHLCQNDSTNRMAFEYLMADLLLSNRLSLFVDNLHFIRQLDYPEMPRVFQEALLVYGLQAGKDRLKELGYTVSPEVEERFSQYHRLYRQRNKSELTYRFGDTYWYYINFVSPHGNKIIVQ